jgi:hypothetical protein
VLTTLLYQGYQRRRGKKYREGDSADAQQQVGLTWSVAPKRPCAFCPQRQQNNPTDESLSCNHTLYVPLTCHEACIFIARFLTLSGSKGTFFLVRRRPQILHSGYELPVPGATSSAASRLLYRTVLLERCRCEAGVCGRPVMSRGSTLYDFTCILSQSDC